MADVNKAIEDLQDLVREHTPELERQQRELDERDKKIDDLIDLIDLIDLKR